MGTINNNYKYHYMETCYTVLAFQPKHKIVPETCDKYKRAGNFADNITLAQLLYNCSYRQKQQMCVSKAIHPKLVIPTERINCILMTLTLSLVMHIKE